MGILKFLWLAVRPVSKLESAIGWWDVLNLAIAIAYPTIGGIAPLSKIFADTPLAWFVGVPILLLAIAGIKLQHRLSKYEANQPEFSLELIPFPKPGAHYSVTKSSDSFVPQKGYAKIAIVNDKGICHDCIGTVISVALLLNGEPMKLGFTATELKWDNGQSAIDIPGDGVPRYLDLAYIDQNEEGKWRLAISGEQQQDYGVGWWKIDVVISSRSQMMDASKLEVVLGLANRGSPPSGLNLQWWFVWHKASKNRK